MKVTNKILETIDSITMDSILVIAGDEYKIVKTSNDLLDIVTTTDPNVFWNINMRSFKTIEEIKNRLIAYIALGKIKVDVLKR